MIPNVAVPVDVDVLNRQIVSNTVEYLIFGVPHVLGVCIVGTAPAPLLVSTCHAVPVATAAGLPLAS